MRGQGVCGGNGERASGSKYRDGGGRIGNDWRQQRQCVWGG